VEKEVIQYLSELVSIPSLSSDISMKPEVIKVTELVKSKLIELEAEVKIVENEVDGKNPILLAKIGNNINKKTILFYSHMDVQPALKDDGWDTDPFILTPKDDGYLYGRGTNDDKGPIVATYFAIKKLLEKGDLPVNIAFLYEGEEESASGGFEETVSKHYDYFGKIDGVLVLDTSWFTDEKPSLDYGFRGISYNSIEITGPKKDQHSGLVGGIIREPMTDLVNIFSKLIDLEGRVLIDGFYDDVLPFTDKEAKLYENLEFSIDELRSNIGVTELISSDPKQIMLNMWRYPALSIHGIEGAFYGQGGKTVVPGTVKGKVSMRLVPNQDPDKIAALFKEYVEKEFFKLNSPNKLHVKNLGNGDWWYGDLNNFLFQAGKKSIIDYWGIEPDFARSGGSIPIIPFMEKIFNAPAMGLGVGQSSDGAHSQNERIRVKNLIGAIEVIKNTLTNCS
jgi:Cys-Gly metallodipeptidase DUG1